MPIGSCVASRARPRQLGEWNLQDLWLVSETSAPPRTPTSAQEFGLRFFRPCSPTPIPWSSPMMIDPESELPREDCRHSATYGDRRGRARHPSRSGLSASRPLRPWAACGALDAAANFFRTPRNPSRWAWAYAEALWDCAAGRPKMRHGDGSRIARTFPPRFSPRPFCFRRRELPIPTFVGPPVAMPGVPLESPLPVRRLTETQAGLARVENQLVLGGAPISNHQRSLPSVTRIKPWKFVLASANPLITCPLSPQYRRLKG